MMKTKNFFFLAIVMAVFSFSLAAQTTAVKEKVPEISVRLAHYEQALEKMGVLVPEAPEGETTEEGFSRLSTAAEAFLGSGVLPPAPKLKTEPEKDEGPLLRQIRFILAGDGTAKHPGIKKMLDGMSQGRRPRDFWVKLLAMEEETRLIWILSTRPQADKSDLKRYARTAIFLVTEIKKMR